ncbi:MAG: sigma-70 family RNA polymerase sigma factor [bacterium]
MDTHEEDIILVRKCLKGNNDAFTSLVNKYKLQIYNLAYRLLGNREEAKDVAQEAFFRAYRSLNKYKITYSFFTWIYTISINVCRNRLKDNKKMQMVSFESPSNLEDDDFELPIASDELTPEEVLQKKRNDMIVQRIISQLPKKYRVVVVLKYLHGLQYNEIANIVNLPLGTVKIQIHRARRVLKELWDKETKNKF